MGQRHCTRLAPLQTQPYLNSVRMGQSVVIHHRSVAEVSMVQLISYFRARARDPEIGGTFRLKCMAVNLLASSSNITTRQELANRLNVQVDDPKQTVVQSSRM